MASGHYVVSQLASIWQFSHLGQVTGPYSSREVAIEAAISAAKASDQADGEVIVRDADMRTHTVWRARVE